MRQAWEEARFREPDPVVTTKSKILHTGIVWCLVSFMKCLCQECPSSEDISLTIVTVDCVSSRKPAPPQTPYSKNDNRNAALELLERFLLILLQLLVTCLHHISDPLLNIKRGNCLSAKFSVSVLQISSSRNSRLHH